MYPKLEHDAQSMDAILQQATRHAVQFLQGLADHPAGIPQPDHMLHALPDEGIGAQAALDQFIERYGTWISGSPGARYFGFVTGGATPASIAGDWLTSAYDQNAAGSTESVTPHIERETIHFLRDLFNLPDAFTGVFVSGATMSNMVSLAVARQWIGARHGIDIAQQGLTHLPPIRVLSGTPHSSIYKALAMLGMGRDSVQKIDTLPDREAVDVQALAHALDQMQGVPCIVVANAGTVNSVDYDDLPAIAALRGKYPFWLHVDGAFGGFAQLSPATQHLTQGMPLADSITIDAHKYLNVPYDSAMMFTRHLPLQAQTFANAAAYLDNRVSEDNFVNLTPENSRRWRALPAWLSLMAYGRAGYQAIVEQTCTLARQLAAWIDESPDFTVLAPVRLNGVVYTLPPSHRQFATIQRYLDALTATGAAFLTPTIYQGVPAVRVSITNWRTTSDDLRVAWQGMQAAWQVIRA